MTTDLKQNGEFKDEELECVAGGVGGDSVDEQPDGGGRPDAICYCRNGKGGRELS